MYNENIMGNVNSGNTSKYKKVYSRKRLTEYLATCKDTYEEILVSESRKSKKAKKTDAEAYQTYKKILKVKLPSVEGYAEFLGKTPRTLQNWAKIEKEFDAALDKIKAVQKQVLIECGLANTYNPTIAKLLLSSNHGMKERVDATSDDKPIATHFTDEQITKIGERLAGGKAGDDNPPSTKESN